MNRLITTIGLDADDTLWHNETIFEKHHKSYCALLSEYHDATTVEKRLFETEMRNLDLYGYGVKSFTLSSIETAISLTNGKIEVEEIHRLIECCKEMLDHPVELIKDVRQVVQELSKNYKLLVITKGDLRDQERKVARSGLADSFDHVEVVSNKSVEDYVRVLERNRIQAEQFLMVGNSVKSDCLPLLGLGAHAAHIPYHLTWAHEHVDDPPRDHDRFHQLDELSDLPPLLKFLNAQLA